MKETFKSKTRLYKVYHIRIKGNEDIGDGYIGITRRNIKYRLSQHYQSQRRVGTILRSIPKDQIEVVELYRLAEDTAKTVEFMLRPDRHVGWNDMAGGNRSTVMCTTCGTPLPKRRTGSQCGKCNDGKFGKGNIPFNYGKGERYKLISPDGEIFFPEAFTVFCRERGLNPQNLRKVASGARHHSNGWKAEKLAA